MVFDLWQLKQMIASAESNKFLIGFCFKMLIKSSKTNQKGLACTRGSQEQR